MSKTLRKRTVCLNLIKSLSKARGVFTINDILNETTVPRSTIQDWINRLVNEGYIHRVEEPAGSRAAKYTYVLKNEFTACTACKNIFTCLDREHNLVEIYHFCGSEGCTNYCAKAHKEMGGVILETRNEGFFLRELAKIGRAPLEGLGSKAGVGIEEIVIEKNMVVQSIKATGGPAYSLTETMGAALGVKSIVHTKRGNYIEGKIYTDALEHITVGIDDTDDLDEGATWAISLSLLNNLKDINRIAHKIVFLNPNIPYKTLGNNAAFIEFAIQESNYERILSEIQNFLQYKTVSEQTAIAVMRGLVVPTQLKQFANKVRAMEVSLTESDNLAKELKINLIEITGERGKVGALASLAFLREDGACLLNPDAQIKV